MLMQNSSRILRQQRISAQTRSRVFNSCASVSFPRLTVSLRKDTLPGLLNPQPRICKWVSRKYAHPSQESSRRLPGSRVGSLPKIRMSSSKLDVFPFILHLVLGKTDSARIREGRKEIERERQIKRCSWDKHVEQCRRRVTSRAFRVREIQSRSPCYPRKSGRKF